MCHGLEVLRALLQLRGWHVRAPYIGGSMSNFWAEFSFPSPVDDILKKPSFTLEELLDEDDVVVDIRSQKDELKE